MKWKIQLLQHLFHSNDYISTVLVQSFIMWAFRDLSILEFRSRIILFFQAFLIAWKNLQVKLNSPVRHPQQDPLLLADGAVSQEENAAQQNELDE